MKGKLQKVLPALSFSAANSQEFTTIDISMAATARRIAAWMLDHDISSYGMISRAFDGKTEGLSRDDVLDNVTLYWLTNTAISSARLYWDTAQISTGGGFFDVRGVTIPVAVSAFPNEIYAAPRSRAERAYPKLIYYNKLDKGGHFAAWEQPQLFTSEMRAAFRSLRPSQNG